MKILWFLLWYLSTLYTKDIICIVPSNMENNIKSIFSTTIEYSKMKVIIHAINQDNTVDSLEKTKNAKFAVVRRDVLAQLQTNTYVTISELPYSAQLSLFQNNETFDIDIDELLKKRISSGSIEDKNSGYLKKIFNFYGMKYNVFYQSYTYEKSIKLLKNGAIDAYFTFLPQDMKTKGIHRQTLFSKDTIGIFDKLGIFNLKYDGIYSPYVLISSVRASDEEIENIIYRLMEKNIFVPITDVRFGPINQYIIIHIKSVKNALQKRQLKKVAQPVKRYINKICRRYHYSFLKLLRKKPQLKKILSKVSSEIKRKIYLKQINTILLLIDKHKTECDFKFLKKEKKKFLNIEKKIKNL